MNRRLTLCALSTAATLTGGLLGVTAASAAPAAGPATASGASTHVRIGMSTPRSEWAEGLADTGAVDARRLFDDLRSPDFAVATARAEILAGRMPIVSFKVPGNDWSGAAAGRYDAELVVLRDRLAALPGKVFVTLHHEPAGDGTPAAYAAMQRHTLPILSPPANVEAGVIVNGFWWSASHQGKTDAEIAEYLPADVLRSAEIVAADTYQGGTTARPGEDAGVKIRRLSAWATRTGVSRLGIGEYNGLSAPAIRSAGDAVLADPRFVFASCFNSSTHNRDGVNWKLTGDRLEAFKNTLSQARSGRTAPVPAVRNEAHGWLSGGGRLGSGQELRSDNGNYRLSVQSDGNSVVYDYTGRALWSSRTLVSGSALAMQTDGNAVVYSPTSVPLWSTGTFGLSGAMLHMQDDGNLVLHRADDTVAWNSFASR